MPSADQVEVLRRAVRYLLAIERVQIKWRELNLTDAQRDQLKERNSTEKSAAESALLKLYGEVWLPRSDNGSLFLESVSIGGRPLQTTLDEKKRAQIHQRLMELLATVQRKVFGSVGTGEDCRVVQTGRERFCRTGHRHRQGRSWVLFVLRLSKAALEQHSAQGNRARRADWPVWIRDRATQPRGRWALSARQEPGRL